MTPQQDAFTSLGTSFFDKTSFPFARKYESTLVSPNYSGICTNGTTDPSGILQPTVVSLPAGPQRTSPKDADRAAPHDHIDHMIDHAMGHADSSHGWLVI